MYKDYRANRIDIEIDVEEYRETCGGCPTIFEFTDTEGTRYYFRLRHGSAEIVCEDNGEELLVTDMNGFDGICSWEEVVEWAKNNRVLLRS